MTDDLNLVALAPHDLAATQATLAEWCTAKRRALAVELEDLEEHLLIATTHGWKLRGLQASITRTTRRIEYYDKMCRAVEAGYLMVPNFPVTVLAVRVQRTTPRAAVATWERSPVLDAHAEQLPAGEGRYVDDRVVHVDDSYQEQKSDGTTKTVTRYVASEYDAPDFPFLAVKPAVITATQAAMALRIFDRVGMVENNSPGRDPIMVGQLLDPRGGGRLCTFFIAWWLDTGSL